MCIDLGSYYILQISCDKNKNSDMPNYCSPFPSTERFIILFAITEPKKYVQGTHLSGIPFYLIQAVYETPALEKYPKKYSKNLFLIN